MSEEFVAPSGVTEMVTITVPKDAVEKIYIPEGPTIGRIVHYVLAPGEIRPAIVVRKFDSLNSFMVNLAVFTDGRNDAHLLTQYERTTEDFPKRFPMLIWRTSVHYDAGDEDGRYKLGTWHWPLHV